MLAFKQFEQLLRYFQVATRVAKIEEAYSFANEEETASSVVVHDENILLSSGKRRYLERNMRHG